MGKDKSFLVSIIDRDVKKAKDILSDVLMDESLVQNIHSNDETEIKDETEMKNEIDHNKTSVKLTTDRKVKVDSPLRAQFLHKYHINTPIIDKSSVKEG